MLIVGAEVQGRRGMCVRTRDGLIAEVAPTLRPEPQEIVLDAAGGAVIPGLHDHHVHLRAQAAALDSVVLGPPEVTNREAFDRALRAARPDSAQDWVRGVGYVESVAGELDRHVLDAVVADRPVRVQHRSGALWVLNSAALAAVGLDRDEHDGRLFRRDEWLASVLPARPLAFGLVATRAAAAGITSFTDATPGMEQADLDLLGVAVARGEIRQRLVLMSAPGRTVAVPELMSLGPFKVILDDTTLPEAPELGRVVRTQHAQRNPVAIHAVTLEQLVTALAGIRLAGPLPGDRIEHASVLAPSLRADLFELGITVVTQPGFVATRGDRYLEAVPADEQPWLYPLRSLRRAAVAVAAGTDAPFGDPDPWRSIAAAVQRRTLSGVVLTPDERIDPSAALDLFLGPADKPGVPRVVRRGGVADLCVLRVPLHEMLAAPDRSAVLATIVAGEPIWNAE